MLKLITEDWLRKFNCWKFIVINWWLEINYWKLFTRNWLLENNCWKLIAGNWFLEIVMKFLWLFHDFLRLSPILKLHSHYFLLTSQDFFYWYFTNYATCPWLSLFCPWLPLVCPWLSQVCPCLSRVSSRMSLIHLISNILSVTTN